MKCLNQIQDRVQRFGL